MRFPRFNTKEKEWIIGLLSTMSELDESPEEAPMLLSIQSKIRKWRNNK